MVSRSKFRNIFLAFGLARLIRQDDVNLAILHVNRNFILAVLAKIFCQNRFKLLYMQHMHVGGNKEIIKDGVNGLLVEPYDIEQLEKALTKLLDDHELSRDLAERARRDVAANYFSQYQCDLLEELFKKLGS